MMPEKYWSDFFGLTISKLIEPGVKVVPHKGLIGYNGAWIFKAGPSLIISVHSDLCSDIESKVRSISSVSDFLSAEFASQLFVDNIERTIGPCYQGYCTENDLTSSDCSAVRFLDSSEYAILESFRQNVTEDDWSDSAISSETKNFGYFEGDKLIAVACLDMWSETVANIGLVTLPESRGKGCARKLCAFATKFGLNIGYEMVYQTLLSNASAVAVARATGYVEYANHLAVRFAN